MKTSSAIAKIFFLFLVLLVSSCQSATPVATSTSLPTPIPTNTSIPTPTATPDPLEACKLIARATDNTGLGFPRHHDRLPSTGTVRSIVLFVDFSDFPARGTPEQVFALMSPGAEEFFSAVSYGRMTYELEPHFVWLRLSESPEHYAEAALTFEGHQDFIQEAVNLADSEVDFSKADSIVVVPPPQAKAFKTSRAFGGTAFRGIRADGVIIANAVNMGSDLLYSRFLILNHEVGHNLSFVDLYSIAADTLGNYEDSHRFVGGFSLMGFTTGNAPEYFAFERWQLGWLDDEQITCQQTNDQTTSLTAIETVGGTKAIVVPLSRVRAVVVESRRAIGYDKKLAKEGALVYLVNTTLPTGEGPIVVYPIVNNDPYRNKSPLAVGESVTVEGVTVTVLEATDEGDTVQVTVTK